LNLLSRKNLLPRVLLNALAKRKSLLRERLLSPKKKVIRSLKYRRLFLLSRNHVKRTLLMQSQL
jgi:hypothetical protein